MMRGIGIHSNGDVPELTGLSEEEKKALAAASGGSSVKATEGQETVSRYKFDQMKKDLDEKLRKSEDKNKKTSDELKKVREERDAALRRAEKAEKESETKDERISGLEKTVGEMDGRIKGFEKREKSRESVTPAKETPREVSLANDLRTAQDRISELETELDYMDYIIGEMADIMSDPPEKEPSQEHAATSSEAPEPVGKIVRSGPSELTSDLFVLPRYKVTLARSGSYISFEPDVDGHGICVDGTISLPALEGLIGYRGREEYSVFRDGKRLVTHLI